MCISRTESDSLKSQSEEDSPELQPVVGRLPFPTSVGTVPLSKAGCPPRRGLPKLVVPQRNNRVSNRRTDDRSRINRTRKATTFPARGKLYPAVQFTDVPGSPQGCRWTFPPNSLGIFSLDWAKEWKESSPDEIFAAREGTARIARALYRGDVIPGWSFGRGDCQITWGGQAVSVFGPGRVQILEGCSINSLAWTPWMDKLPRGAFKAGRTYDGENLFVGRSCIRGRILFGRFQESYGALLVSAGGAELVFGSDFEILTERSI